MKRQGVYGGVAIALFGSVGLAQSVTIDNGVVGDGHLRIGVDGYGAYSNWNWGANLDYWDPVGPYPEGSPTFAAWFGLYANGVDAVAFAEPFFDIDNTYNLRGGTFDLPTPSNPSVNPRGDTATSAWSSRNFAGDLSFDFELVQTVSGAAGEAAQLTQVLTITSRSAAPVDFEIQRHLDIDMPFFINPFGDVVGTVLCNGTIQPYQRPADGNRNSPAIMGLTSPDTFDYLAAKNGFDPGGGTLIGFGTDFQIWDNFGYPAGWRNYTAGIGHAPLVGEFPAGLCLGRRCDAFINIEWKIHLEVNESTTITAIVNYGSDCVGGCPACACEFDPTGVPNVCDIFDFLAFQDGFVAGDPCACDFDPTGPIGVCDIFDFLAFQDSFVSGPCP